MFESTGHVQHRRVPRNPFSGGSRGPNRGTLSYNDARYRSTIAGRQAAGGRSKSCWTSPFSILSISFVAIYATYSLFSDPYTVSTDFNSPLKNGGVSTAPKTAGAGGGEPNMLLNQDKAINNLQKQLNLGNQNMPDVTRESTQDSEDTDQDYYYDKEEDGDGYRHHQGEQGNSPDDGYPADEPELYSQDQENPDVQSDVALPGQGDKHYTDKASAAGGPDETDNDNYGDLPDLREGEDNVVFGEDSLDDADGAQINGHTQDGGAEEDTEIDGWGYFDGGSNDEETDLTTEQVGLDVESDGGFGIHPLDNEDMEDGGEDIDSNVGEEEEDGAQDAVLATEDASGQTEESEEILDEDGEGYADQDGQEGIQSPQEEENETDGGGEESDTLALDGGADKDADQDGQDVDVLIPDEEGGDDGGGEPLPADPEDGAELSEEEQTDSGADGDDEDASDGSESSQVDQHEDPNEASDGVDGNTDQIPSIDGPTENGNQTNIELPVDKELVNAEDSATERLKKSSGIETGESDAHRQEDSIETDVQMISNKTDFSVHATKMEVEGTVAEANEEATTSEINEEEGRDDSPEEEVASDTPQEDTNEEDKDDESQSNEGAGEKGKNDEKPESSVQYKVERRGGTKETGTDKKQEKDTKKKKRGKSEEKVVDTTGEGGEGQNAENKNDDKKQKKKKDKHGKDKKKENSKQTDADPKQEESSAKTEGEASPSYESTEKVDEAK